MMKRERKWMVLLVLYYSLFLTGGSYAQEPPADAGASATPAATTPAAPAPLIGGLTQEQLMATFTGTFFLTPVELAGIQQALAGKKMSAATLAVAPAPAAVVPQGPRIIRVSGVYYRSPEDWIVWMNGQKLTPENRLPEIINIEVRKTSDVDLLWYDSVLNKILKLTLRPQQTYDIGAGVLLPAGQ